MIDNQNDNNGAEAPLSGNAILDILNRACAHAHGIYRDADPDDCAPLMTGCRENCDSVIMPLKPVLDAQPDPKDVAAAKSVVQSLDCDYVLIFYPVHIAPDDENDDSEPAFGVIVEIQPRGLPPVKRVVPIDREAPGNTQALPKLPVLGRAFGVFYPHLLNDTRAA